MAGLDTNVLVRWAVEDDERQTQCVRRLLQQARADGVPLFVSNTTLLELEWVLRSSYNFESVAVIQLFTALLETQEITLQDEAALEQALHLYRQDIAGFAECLHAGHCASAGHLPMLTFDRDAARLPVAKLLVV